MIEMYYRWLVSMGLDNLAIRYISLGLVLLATWLVYRFAHYLINNPISYLIAKSETKWDDYLLRHGFFSRLTYFIPALFLYLFAPLLENFIFGNWRATVNTATISYSLAIFILLVDSIVKAVLEAGLSREELNEVPLTSLTQALRIVLYMVGVVLLLAVWTDMSPIPVVSGLGAFFAVASFVYRDALHGLVASIQLTASKVIARGDWIEIPEYDVNGIVSEVGLMTLKVVNLDSSTTAVPTHALTSTSLKSWQSMLRSGGRRVARAIYIDITSIKFCTADLLTQLHPIPYLEPHLNASLSDNATDYERPTNSELFRLYIIEYLRHHPRINQELTLAVYQREPTTQGLPLQLIFHALDKDFVNYVTLQSKIFDHLLAMAPHFELEIFQIPAGKDVRPRLEESR